MSIVNIPGYSGYVLDTSNGGIARVGSSGGFRHPTTGALNQWGRFDEVGGGLGTAAYNLLGQMGAFGNNGGGMGDELIQMQMDAINRANEIQEEILGRENARRNAYNRYTKGERWTPTNMEEDQGQLAARSAAISAKEQERLGLALDGKLPVQASTERNIAENRSVLNERLRRNLGQAGYETSSPGTEALGKFDESAKILEETDKNAYIERGIQPSITAAQFAQDAVGQYVPPENQSLSAAFQALQKLALGREQIAANQASDYIKSRQTSNSGGGIATGAGKVAGAIGGPLLNWILNEKPQSSSGSNTRSYGLTPRRSNASASTNDRYGQGFG